MSFKERVLTKPGYKFLVALAVIYVFFTAMSLTQPIVVVNEDNMVISVDGNPTYRPLTSWDLRETKIIKEKK